jgi:excisionase family DNA binding protein
MSAKEKVQKTFCTTREAAKLLGVSLRTAQLWSENGLLEAWKTAGGHRRITRNSIERLLSLPNKDVLLGASAAAESAKGLPSTADGLRILVVEDDASLRRLYEIKLARWPSRPEIATAADGYEALVRIGLHRPDFLIVDLQMPGMDGFRMLRTIHSAPEFSGMTIVVVSGLDADEISRRGNVPEGIPILAKPIPFDRLEGIATELIEARRKAQAKAIK